MLCTKSSKKQIEKIIISIIITIIISLHLYSEESQELPIIHIANLKIATQIGFTPQDRISPLLKLMLIEKPQGAVRYKNLVDASYNDWIINSYEDVKKVAALNKANFILFGDLFIRDDSLEAHIYLYDRENDKIALDVKHELVTINENLFAKELADKIYNEMEELFKIPPPEKKAFHFPNYLGFYNGIGYYVPIGTGWNTQTGIIAAETGLTFVRLSVFKNETVSLMFRPHLGVSYSLGINKPEIAETYFHAIQVLGSCAFNIELLNRVGFLIGAGIHGRFEILTQNYFNTWRSFNQNAFGAHASLDFEYWFGKNRTVALGLKNLFEFNFFDTVAVDYRIMVYTLVRLKERE